VTVRQTVASFWASQMNADDDLCAAIARLLALAGPERALGWWRLLPIESARVGIERELLDSPVIAFGITVVRDPPDFTHRINRAFNAKFGEHRAK